MVFQSKEIFYYSWVSKLRMTKNILQKVSQILYLFLNKLWSSLRFKPTWLFNVRQSNTWIDSLQVIFQFLKILQISFANYVCWYNSEVVHDVIWREKASCDSLVVLDSNFEFLGRKIHSLHRFEASYWGRKRLSN